jgi:hypothetical protein
MDSNLGIIKQPDDRIRQARELTKRVNNLAPSDWNGLFDRYANADINLAIRCVDIGHRHRVLSSKPFQGGHSTAFILRLLPSVG